MEEKESVRTAIIAVIYTCCLGHTLTPYLEIPPPKVCHQDRQKTSHYRGLIRFESALAIFPPLSLIYIGFGRRRRWDVCRRTLLNIPIMKWHRFYITRVCFCASSSYTIPSRKADIRLDLLKPFRGLRIVDLRHCLLLSPHHNVGCCNYNVS